MTDHWQERAQTAETQLAEAQQRLSSIDSELASARETVAALERRQKIDALLSESDAIDLDAARLLTEAAVAQMDAPDLKLAVEDLRRHKPYLFRHRRAADSAASAAQLEDTPEAEQAAQRAAATGQRNDLLRYLRLRRNT
jgi:hypothetical protein